MKIRPPKASAPSNRDTAVTLVEVMVAGALVTVFAVALYAGFSSGFTILKAAREDLRATQIMVQRMEAVRLYTWVQLTNPSYLPTTFVERYDPSGQTGGSGGVIYAGRLTVDIPPASSGLPDGYRSNIARMTVQVFWTNRLGRTNVVVRSRSMQTYAARYGMQNYIFGR